MGLKNPSRQRASRPGEPVRALMALWTRRALPSLGRLCVDVGGRPRGAEAGRRGCPTGGTQQQHPRHAARSASRNGRQERLPDRIHRTDRGASEWTHTAVQSDARRHAQPAKAGKGPFSQSALPSSGRLRTDVGGRPFQRQGCRCSCRGSGGNRAHGQHMSPGGEAAHSRLLAAARVSYGRNCDANSFAVGFS